MPAALPVLADLSQPLAWMPGPWELVLILVIILIFFGVGKLPRVLSQMGKGVKAFKQGMGEGEDEGLAELEDGGAKPKKRAREAVHEADEV
jgi:sec-independent protein translocase protein TatA